MSHQTALLRLQLRVQRAARGPRCTASRRRPRYSISCGPWQSPHRRFAFILTQAQSSTLSITGTRLEGASVKLQQKQQRERENKGKPVNDDDTVAPASAPTFPRIYVSLSTIFNNDARHATTFKDLVQAIPSDRLLLESDHYIGEHGWDQMNRAVATSVAAILGGTVPAVLDQTGENFRQFCRVPRL